MGRTELAVAVPASWRREPRFGRVRYLAPTTPPSGVTPRLDYVVGRGSGGWPPSPADLGLPDALVEDEDTFEVGGHPAAYRRLLHREDGADLVSDEWSWRLDDLGVALVGTVALADYPEWCEVFESVAETFRPPTPMRPAG
jgi:hypothetical protein